jgi:hypothetical protein
MSVKLEVEISMFWIYGIIGTLFGGVILFDGRRKLWATLGIVSLVVSARVLAVFAAGLDSGRDLIEFQQWNLFAIAIAIGLVGIILGWFAPKLSVLIIGFAAGADVALFFYEISSYLITVVAQMSELAAQVLGLGIIIIGGLLGLWFVRRSRDEALILITMLIGVQLIQDAAGLNPDSSWTAILLTTLALAGILAQYALYLREQQEALTELEPLASSIAYFQDLELDT